MRDEFLNGLDEGELLALPYLFEFWAMGHQLPPDGDWKTWVILGGRGAGKTRAGAEWVRSMVEGARPLDAGRASRVALVGETLEQVREVVVHGESGIIACSPPDRKPVWHETRRRLTWPNGAMAQAFSAHDPERLRGPQFDAAWVDELAKWKNAEATWDMLQFGLRLGENPQQVVTTTPRNVPVLKRILELDTTVQTHAATEDNRANLAESFLAEVHRRYAGTRLGRQELEGVLMADIEGALWTRSMLDAAQVSKTPELDRVVVAVDPPVTGTAQSDECGIVVVGAVMDGRRRNGGLLSWRTHRWPGNRRRDGRKRLVRPRGAGGRTGWWRRSIRAVIWSRVFCGRSTRLWPIGRCGPPGARWRGRSRWRLCTSRGVSRTCGGLASWKTRCV